LVLALVFDATTGVGELTERAYCEARYSREGCAHHIRPAPRIRTPVAMKVKSSFRLPVFGMLSMRT
jgi:hypothetical protein